MEVPVGQLNPGPLWAPARTLGTAGKIVICSARDSADTGPIGRPAVDSRPAPERRHPMIRRIRRTLPWLGAVAALLLLALPVQADDIEPDPYVDALQVY